MSPKEIVQPEEISHLELESLIDFHSRQDPAKETRLTVMALQELRRWRIPNPFRQTTSRPEIASMSKPLTKAELHELILKYELFVIETGRPSAELEVLRELRVRREIIFDRGGEPVPMLLWCPYCHERHIDIGEFATKVHHTYACQKCGLPWRPALVPTVGVQHLPGFKDKE